MSADFWAGYISGALSIIIGNPLDLLKVHLQASSRPALPSSSSSPTPFPTPSSLIRGTAAPILTNGALNALLFVTYNPGTLGGLISSLISTPTELIKCRAQLSSPPQSSYSILRSTLRTTGLPGLYYGGGVTALRDSIGYGFYFWSYELCSRMFAEYYSSSSSSTHGEGTLSSREEAAKILLCGGIAGVVTWASVFPLDVIKTRVQAQVLHISTPETGTLLGSGVMQKKGAWEIARLAYRNEGAGVFFRGLGVCSLRAFIVNAAQWAVYEWIMRELSVKEEGVKMGGGEVLV
ncbi:solute carrier family 25 member 45 protein [Rutstroemia sp. NJR-2017a BBW]|nr:solute carrier family 25 member 45 protein [Rutstroemia sp. NJR-2017a BBW]